MPKASLRTVAACAALLVLPAATARGQLLVDFSNEDKNVASNAAPFVFTDRTDGPFTKTYTSGSQGYTGGTLDTGAGVTAALGSFRTDAALPAAPQLRMIDRDDAKADLVSDWASVEPGASVQNTGLRLTLTGLTAGRYTFTSSHDDTSNQEGVLDAQYSLDGGTTWLNAADNASYDLGTTVSVNDVTVDPAFGLSVRYLAGGGLYGTAGVNGDTNGFNRLVPLNSFELTAVPEPGGVALLAAGLAGLSARRRRAFAR